MKHHEIFVWKARAEWILFLERKRIKKNFRFATKALLRQGFAPGNESKIFIEK